MNYRMATQSALFANLQPDEPKSRKPKPPEKLRTPLWTVHKASLIDEYIHLFLVVTKHGVYLDLFAGPQRANDRENWSVRRVLERRTKGNPAIGHYAVCDRDPEKARMLRDIGRKHNSFRVYEGDANERIHEMLKDAPIDPKKACFCLIDQRTFECHWSTVQAVAQYKQEGYKIEMFYFLAQGWLDRAWASTKEKERLAAWWGNNGYEEFRKLSSIDRAQALCRRFRDELGYAYADPFPICEKGHGSRTMYYMIHASDHPEACKLMSRAYNKVLPQDHFTDGPLLWDG